MTSLNARTSLIDLSKTDLAKDARPHDPAALEILAHDMKEQGQLQEIIVEKKGTRYVVIAGVGRTLAARKLGWKEIRASVRERVSDFDKARITFAENEDREDADPFYQASMIMKMLRAKGCTQQELAIELGVSVGMISGYVLIEGLPMEIRQKFNRLNFAHLTQIARLKQTDLKIDLAEKCEKMDLSVRQVKSIVDRSLRKPAFSRLGRSAVSDIPAVSVVPDPLLKLWQKLHDGTDLPMEVWWETHYGVHKVKDGPELTGHFFFVSPQPEFSAHALAEWFRGMAQALEGGNANNLGTGTHTAPKSKGISRVVDNLGTGTNNVPKVLGIFEPRLPKNSAEHAELTELSAKKGPKAVYAWIYGPNSPMTQAIPVNTWKEMGTTPKEGLKQVLDGLRSFGKTSVS